jgi:DMSO/TMAO reductase YedYZ molybdopterin-dependent catalytic subunit
MMSVTPDDREKYQHGEPLTAAAVKPGVIISPDTQRGNRIPPGQTRTRKWPVLHYGRVPIVPLDRWRLEVFGCVARPLQFTWQEFRALPRVQVFSDFHCVTTWSRLSNVWEGVSARGLLDQAGILPDARFVLLKGYDDGWTTNMPLTDFLEEDVLLADTHDGAALSAEHGGPLRAIVPRLYAWKSAKWLRSIELAADDRPGLWEQEGYHNHGDPWLEERFG